ncbi:MAG: ankyrin repeat domain-containing protein [Gemmatimonadales bacterium]
MLEDLLDACRRNDLERVRALVTADPTLLTRQASTGETPLLAALYHRSGETVSWLREQRWPRSIFEAAAIDDVAGLEQIIAVDPAGADTYSRDGWTPLHLAAFFGSAGAADLLLSHGADPRRIARNAMANTPLHAALAAKRLALVDLLLQRGADPSIECAGYTPMEIAQAGTFDAAVPLLQQAIARAAQ